MKQTMAFLMLGVALGSAACSRSPAEPAERPVNLSVIGGSTVYGTTNALLPDPLEVVAVDAQTRLPVEGVPVEWRVVAGSGTITPASASTNVDGVAAATFRAGPLGTYRVRASSSRLTGPAAEFDIRIVPLPQISSVQPTAITAGGSVVIQGANFSPTADHNAVLFDGVRGTVTAATATELTVTVPACLPGGSVALTVALGSAVSSPTLLQATAAGGQTIGLAVGETRTFTQPAEIACVRVPGGIAGALYLFTTHNPADTHAPPVRFELRSLNASSTALAAAARPQTTPFAEAWEFQLRERERTLLRTTGDPAAFFAPAALRVQVPSVGERASFNVLTPKNTFQSVNATVKKVSARAVIYVDDEAPANGFTDADLQQLADLFDSPIYPTNVGVFGEPSDIDGNQRVTILLTPRINALTPRGSASFAAGYFYGCDLLARTRCSGSNLGEIFYSMVPDPNAQWSDRRTTSAVMNILPPVLAHEFQHMIHFARRNQSTDALWLAEGLAHTAEELVGDELQAQGASLGLVSTFKAPNYSRAQRYLVAPGPISLLAEDSPGSLELRGAAWLLLKYLRGHYGGNNLLRSLTGSSLSGPANVAQQVGKPWDVLMRDFGVALWADGAPQLTAPVDVLHTFNDFDPRAVIGAVSGGYPLQPTQLGWADFFVTGSIGAASQTHFLLTAPTGGGPNLNFVLSAAHGAPFDTGGRATLTILRVR